MISQVQNIKNMCHILVRIIDDSMRYLQIGNVAVARKNAKSSEVPYRLRPKLSRIQYASQNYRVVSSFRF